MRQSTRVRLIGLLVCLALVAAWTVLVVPGTALAKKKGPPGGGGNFETRGYWVWFSSDSLGAFDPNGPAPEGSATNGTDGGSMSVSAGAIESERNTRIIVNTNLTVLTSFFGARIVRSALEEAGDDIIYTPSYDDFDFCIPESFGKTMVISEDGTTAKINLSGSSLSGRELGYALTIYVSSDDDWAPLGLGYDQEVILTCDRWELTTSNLKQQSKGCSASGNFSGDTVKITVKRWTEDEQTYQDANE